MEMMIVVRRIIFLQVMRFAFLSFSALAAVQTLALA